MSGTYAQVAARNDLLRAALRCIAADYFADDADPHADAESEYAGERLALAARELVAAVDALPEGDQPIGWVSGRKGRRGLTARDIAESAAILAGCVAIPFGTPIPRGTAAPDLSNEPVTEIDT